jgi:hypothetical protein
LAKSICHSASTAFRSAAMSWRPVLSQRDGRCRQTLLSPTDPIEVNCDLPLGGIAMEGH